MKRIIFLVLLVLIILALVGCSNEPDGRINVPSGTNDYEGANYQDVIAELEAAGFTNIQTEVLDDIITGWMTEDGEVEAVAFDGDTTFSGDSKYLPDVEIIITYHTFPSSGNSEEAAQSSNEPSTDNMNETVLTVDNCEELRIMLSVEDENDPLISEFAADYQFRRIEFDGYIASVDRYRDYDTRFNLLVYSGDYRTEDLYGPAIQIENVGLDEYPEVEESQNANVHIIAEVFEYARDQGLLKLNLISIQQR